MKYETITLPKFLSRTLGLEGKNLKRITHLDVKELFPNLKRSSFEYVNKYPEDLANGKIMMVSDGKSVIPYYVPEITRGLVTQEVNMEFTPTKKKEYENHDYTSMSIYELKQLLNTKFNSYKNSREARKELESRGVILTKKYNRSESKRRIEEE